MTIYPIYSPSHIGIGGSFSVRTTVEKIQMSSIQYKNPKLYNESLAGKLAIPTTVTYNQQNIYGNVIVINREGVSRDVFPLTRQKCRIGRDLGCDIRIQRPTVSKEHALIIVDKDDSSRVYLQNLSENGLLLCGKFIGRTNIETKQDVDKILLNDGDIFTISGRSFKFNYPKHNPMKKSLPALQYQSSPKPSINTQTIVDENAKFNNTNRTPKKEILQEALNTLLSYTTPTKKHNDKETIQNTSIQVESSLPSPWSNPTHPPTIIQFLDSNSDNQPAIEQDLIIFSPQFKHESKKRKASSPLKSRRLMSKFQVVDIAPLTTEESTPISSTTNIIEPKSNNSPSLVLPFLTPQKPKKKAISKELQDLINRNSIISSPALIKTRDMIVTDCQNTDPSSIHDTMKENITLDSTISETPIINQICDLVPKNITKRTVTISDGSSICSATKTPSKLTSNDHVHMMTDNDHIISNYEFVTPNSPRRSTRLNNRLATNNEESHTFEYPIPSDTNPYTIGSNTKRVRKGNDDMRLDISESTPPPLSDVCSPSLPSKSPPIAKRTRRHTVITETLDSIIASSPTLGKRTVKRK